MGFEGAQSIAAQSRPVISQDKGSVCSVRVSKESLISGSFQIRIQFTSGSLPRSGAFHPPLFDRNGRYLGYAADRFFYAAGRANGTPLIKPVYCGYYLVGAGGVAAAAAGLFFLAEKGVDFSVETEGNSPVQPAPPPPPPPKTPVTP